MTFLVLLAAAAWTHVVAAYLRLVAFDGFDDVVTTDARRLLGLSADRPERARRRWLRSRAADRRRHRRARVVQDERRLSLPPCGGTRRQRGITTQDRPQPPQVPDDLFVDPVLHRLEQLEALFFVLDQRIALAVAAQADAFLEVVEAVEMVFPVLIDHLQHDVALDAAQNLRADQLFLLLVRVDDLLPQRVADFRRRAVAEVERAGLDPEHAIGLALQRIEIPR